jgi:hypothetical protein
MLRSKTGVKILTAIVDIAGDAPCEVSLCLVPNLLLFRELKTEWPQVELDGEVIRVEGEPAKAGEVSTGAMSDGLIQILEPKEPKTGTLFEGTNLRKTWDKTCDACGFGKLELIDKQNNRRYTGSIGRDLRRSAIKNLKTGGNDRAAMAISGHNAGAVFDRRYIVVETDVLKAMRRIQAEKSDGVAARETSVRVASNAPL